MKVVATAAFFAASALASTAAAQAPPIAAFARLPAIEDVAISPGGQRFAILGGTADKRTISIATLDDPQLRVVELGEVKPVSLSWAGDDYVLAQLAVWRRFGPKNAYEFERTLAITPEGKVASQLLEHDAASSAMISQPILRITEGAGPQAIILGLQLSAPAAGGMDSRLNRKERADPFIRALWRVDPKSGRGVIVERGGPQTSTWEVDGSGTPRIRIDRDPETGAASVLAREKGAAAWRPFWKPTTERDYYITFVEPENAIYVREGDRILRRSLSGGEPTLIREIAAHEHVPTIWAETGGPLLGTATGGEKPGVEWIAPEMKAAQAAVARAFPGRNAEIYSWSRDRTRFVLRVQSPDTPDEWFVYDRPKKELSPIGAEYPELKGVALGRTQWLTYRARDGMEIPAYLTLPASETAGGNPPLVVLPHGGPASRDDYTFDYLTQFLASRGYAVLRPQFRGSWGFGDAYQEAGRGEWGGKMQTDLLDGIAAVGALGVVDVTRTCIVGASFGGYAALASATFYPQAYRCAASIAGVSDLGLLTLQDIRMYGDDTAALRSLRRELDAASPDKLAATSPAQHAAKAGPPILLIHGGRDVVVAPEQSVVMAEALKKAGKPYELILLEGDGHQLASTSGRSRTLQAIEAFLAKHLPVR